MTGERVRRATLRDVAVRAGVHPATASRALDPATRSRVADNTAKRVMRAARALNYEANPIARSLRTSRSLTVGMLIPDLTNPLFPPMVRGAEHVLAEHGYALLLGDTDNDASREERLYDALRRRQVDGLIVGTARRDDAMLERAARDEVPCVLLNRLTDRQTNLAVVGDEWSGVALAVEHLAGLGHHRIAYLAGPQDTSTGYGRLAAFKQATATCGLDGDPSLVTECAAWTIEAGASALADLLDRAVRFTAIVAGNDMIAVGCYQTLRDRGIAVPGKVSVVGYNDMRLVDMLAPALTTVRVDTYALGVEAARLLIDQLAVGASGGGKVVVLPVDLVVRASTAAPTGSARMSRPSGVSNLVR